MKPVADLIDFYRRWYELRGTAAGLLRKRGLTAREKTVLAWLIILADRVGKSDISR